MRARLRLGLAAEQSVLLYAGNLDRYQGVERLLAALGALPAAALIVGTQSDPAALWAQARRAGVAQRVRVARLDGELARAELHAAADAAAIVRHIPGGLPIKLLDALSRGLPCVAVPTATAGLPLGDAVVVSADDTGAAFAAALRKVLSLAPAQRGALGEAGRRYLAEQHTTERFIAALDELLSHALAGR
jgi:glycosyltransferase involved in cell wall biosynthesis